MLQKRPDLERFNGCEHSRASRRHASSRALYCYNKGLSGNALFGFWCSARTTYSMDASGLRDREIEARESYPEISLAAHISN